MNKSYNGKFLNNSELLDSIQINCKNAIYSSHKDDPIFNNKNFIIRNPIFCSGRISSISSNINNYKVNDSVIFLSFKLDLNIELSSNLVCKISNYNDYNLISVVPYASYAMKILRIINPKIGQNIVLIGSSFFSILLKEILNLSGANIFIFDGKNMIAQGLDTFLNEFKEFQIDSLIYLSEFDKELQKLIKNLNINQIFHISQISIYDKGIKDPNYIKGIKYPYTYVRWDFHNNLKYFIYLIENNIINLNFIDFRIKKVSSLKEITDNINKLPENTLYLIQFQ